MYVNIISISCVVLSAAMSMSLVRNFNMNNNWFLQGGSLHGKFKDATPFRSSVESGSKSASLVDELGDMLKEKGFNYHGCEVLYSGVYGTELTCEIFIGPVYYQRLRHMVSDKYQVSKFTVFPSY